MKRWSGKGWAAFAPLPVWHHGHFLYYVPLLWKTVTVPVPPSPHCWESGSTKPWLLRSHSTVITQSRAIWCMHVWKVSLATQNGEADHRGICKRRERPNNSIFTVKHSTTERLIKWVWVQWPLSWNELAVRSCCRAQGGTQNTISPLPSPGWAQEGPPDGSLTQVTQDWHWEKCRRDEWY